MEVTALAKDVRCSVESCKYNCDKRCEASCIQVNNCHCKKATENDETSCDTFELK